jgi:phosphatidylglycerophosphatase C
MNTTTPISKTPSAERVVVAAFDFDGTLTRGDTLIPFLWRSLGLWLFCRAMVLSAPWLLAYLLGLITNEHAKTRLLRMSVSGWTAQRATRSAEQFVSQVLPGMWRSSALEQLRDHQQRGHQCVLISASPDLYLEAVARLLRVDGLICTRMALDQGHYTGELATPNCYGPQKVIRLEGWLRDHVGAQAFELYAYGDSAGDRELLAVADHAWFRGRRRR